MTKAEYREGSDNIFRDLGFSKAEAEEALAKSELIAAIDETIRRRRLTQSEAAKLCETDQPTLSKVLRGRMESVTIDRLAAWLNALGRTVEIRVHRRVAGKPGHLIVRAAS
ncbi:MAG: helix-turn-helix domain-containing protein [Alphaproteobacteria bacterium]|nr:helix-turn-helix domain-containing protein [Alphaproteobacteria bacterium]